MWLAVPIDDIVVIDAMRPLVGDLCSSASEAHSIIGGCGHCSACGETRSHRDCRGAADLGRPPTCLAVDGTSGEDGSTHERKPGPDPVNCARLQNEATAHTAPFFNYCFYS